MYKLTKQAVMIFGIISLHACAAAPERPDMPVAGAFEKADANEDLFIDYTEFKNYVVCKASPDPVERAQVKEEASRGYLAHQKRFLMLDQNNDGKLSYIELGGG